MKLVGNSLSLLYVYRVLGKSFDEFEHIFAVEMYIVAEMKLQIKF